jgi:hypothetical protein
MNNPNSMPSQADKIQALLIERRGEWVPMPELAHVSGAYSVHSRIAELRTKRGLQVQTKVTSHGREKFSFYRLPMVVA